MSKVWLITGSGNGLGKNIAKVALAKGEKVITTARKIENLNDLVQQYGDQIRVATLDVTDEKAAQAAVQLALDAFGSLDVLVNNAGYGDTIPFEQASSDDFRQLVDTCFFGVVNLSRAAIPIMRQQRSGHILHISSTGGRFATPGNAAYHASKWAVGGFTEAVSAEIAPFGIKMTALEPGGMRTNWGKRAFDNRRDMLPEYQTTIGSIMKQLESYWGNEPGDPEKVAEVVYKVAYAEKLPAHILLGGGAVEQMRQIEGARMAEAERWSEITDWIDFGVEGPMPSLPTA
ncbi:SDR family NAD(P)-dependent oxidoreductase [Paenibacillus sp. HB172176]|uniref:SDR family NAD(P)-dependent oxidoreductase n=1 Tax=Paenibacillus sp. HB172176 TaxID=2493690 RepID=UPI00143936B6|nr:SDR family NAD(P)-dependent oxidoreductase [Paenibacillus sp. HB172176]